jgi:hypothetical protein
MTAKVSRAYFTDGFTAMDFLAFIPDKYEVELHILDAGGFKVVWWLS